MTIRDGSVGERGRHEPHLPQPFRREDPTAGEIAAIPVWCANHDRVFAMPSSTNAPR
jgi:hypothetical protein